MLAERGGCPDGDVMRASLPVGTRPRRNFAGPRAKRGVRPAPTPGGAGRLGGHRDSRRAPDPGSPSRTCDIRVSGDESLREGTAS